MFSNLKNLKQTNVILIVVFLIKWNVTKVLCDDKDVRRQPYKGDKDPVGSQPFQEFFIEHNVTKADAVKAFWEQGAKLLDDG